MAINVTKNLSGMSQMEIFEYYYNYQYDYESSVNDVVLAELVPVAIIYSITLLVGVVGNSLVIFSIAYYGRLQNVTNVFLLSLASADLLLVIICVPIKFAAFFAFTWRYGEFLCKAVHYMQNVSMICSVWTLTVMSIERFIAIRYPLQAKYVCTITHARIMVVAVWLFSFVLAIPIIFGRIHKPVGWFKTHYWCVKEWSLPVYGILYEMYMLILMFIVPLVLMILAYSVICVEVWKVASIRASMRTGRVITTQSGTGYSRNTTTRWDNHDASTPLTTSAYRTPKAKFTDDKETRKQVVIMLMVVVALFALCWAPILINNVLSGFNVLDYQNHGYLRYMRLSFWLMAYVNSCINPVVYAFMSRNFRQTFKYAVCACIRGKAFIRAYRYSRSFSTRTSTMNTNGRIIYPHERSVCNSVANTTALRPPSSEYIELEKLSE